ncbi:MAG: tetratricopeptide repeat protein, partial [Planctomycetota bacterium]
MKHERSQREAIAHALDHARLALAGNLLDAALDHVREALRRDPDHAEARLLEARIRLRRHEPRLALTALDNHGLSSTGNEADADTARPDVDLMRATALASSGRIDLAVALMESLADRFPGDAGVLRTLAGMQVHANRPAAAAHTLGQVLELEPDDRTSARLRSDLLTHSDPAAALDALGTIDDHNRRRAARLCVACDRLPEAEAHYAELLAPGIGAAEAEDEADGDLAREAAAVAEALGDLPRAADRLTLALADPDQSAQSLALTHRRLARLHLLAGKPAQAGRAFHRATRLVPADAEAWAGLVVAARVAGKPRLMHRADAALRKLTDRAERRRLLTAFEPSVAAAPVRDPQALGAAARS